MPLEADPRRDYGGQESLFARVFRDLEEDTVHGVERMLSPPHVHTGIKPGFMRAWVPPSKPLPIFQHTSY